MNQFKDGQRVKATSTAYRNGLFESKFIPVFGTVVGFKRPTKNSECFVRVRRDGLKSALIYHPSFWERVTPAEERKHGIYTKGVNDTAI